MKNASLEEWRPIEGFEGAYEVSNFGRIRGVDRKVACRQDEGQKCRPRSFLVKGGIIAVKAAGGRRDSRYHQVTLCKDGKKYYRYVHRVVAKAFIPNQNNDRREVNHKNGLRNDNRAENLEWCTRSENALHSYRELGRSGNLGRKSILTDEEVMEIRRESNAGSTIRSLSKKYGVSSGTIWRAREPTRWWPKKI